MKKVNLCCGAEVLEGWENYDIRPVNDSVNYLDCAKIPLPFKDNSVDVFNINQGLEHLEINPLKFMNDIYRSLKVGGYIRVGLPVYSPFVYHIRTNHPIGYFQSICKGSPYKAKYIDGEFVMKKIYFDKRSFKGMIWTLLAIYRRLRYVHIYFEMGKEE